MCWQCDCRSHHVLTVRLQVPSCVDSATAGPSMCWHCNWKSHCLQCDCRPHHVLTVWLQIPSCVDRVTASAILCLQCECKSHVFSVWLLVLSCVLTVWQQVPSYVDSVTASPIMCWQCDCKSCYFFTAWVKSHHADSMTASSIMCWHYDCRSHHVWTVWLRIPLFLIISLQREWSPIMCGQCDCKSHYFSLFLYSVSEVPSCVDSVTANPIISHYFFTAWVKSHHVWTVWLQIPLFLIISLQREWSPIMCWQCDCKSHYFSLFLYSVSEVPSCVDSVTANPIISHYFFTAWVKSHHLWTVWLQIPLFLIISLQREWSPIMCWQCDCKSHYFSLFLYSVSEVPSSVDSVTANPIISHYFFTAWVKSHHVWTVWLQVS